MFMIKQLSYSISNKDSLTPLDFCVSSTKRVANKWLSNINGNGWSYENTQGVYTKFKLVVFR